TVAARDLLDALNGIDLTRIDGVCRAELFGPTKFLRVDIHADDRRRAREPRALDDAVAHTAAAEDGDTPPRPHLPRVERRADARHHAAANERHLRVRQPLIDHDRLPRVDDGVRAEGADAEDGVERDAVLRAHPLLRVQAGRAVVRLAAQAE